MRAIQLFVGGFAVAPPFLYVIFHSGISAHNFARAAELLLILLIALILVTRRQKIFFCSLGGFKIGVTLLSVTLLAFSMGMARLPLVALREISLWFGLLFLIYALCQSVREKGSRLLLMCLAIGVFAYNFAYFVLVGLSLSGGCPIQLWELVFGFDNPRFLNHCQTVALPVVSIALIQRGWPRVMRLIALGACVGIVVLAALTVARATGVAWVIALFLGVLVVPRAGRFPLIVILLIVIFGIGLAAALKFSLPELGYIQGYEANAKELSSSHSRGYLWGIAWDMVRGSPWLGVGPMHFADVPNAKGAHPHNMYLMLMAETGLPFAALAISAMVFGLWRMALLLRRSTKVDVCQGSALWVALVAMAVDAGFSGNGVMPLSQLWGAIALAMVCAWWPREPSEALGNGASLTLRVGLAAVMAGLVTISAWELTAPVPSIGRQVQPGQPGEMRPRFWSHGWIGP